MCKAIEDLIKEGRKELEEKIKELEKKGQEAESKVREAEKEARAAKVNTSERIARNLLTRGTGTLEDIAEATGLSLDRVRELAENA